MKKIRLSLLIFFPALIAAQTKIGLESLVPPAPNAAELGKYGTIPVGTLTGVPEINFPLYEVISGSLKLPISLSYHASGIQVNQKSTDVGLGWSLMAGGTISRTVYSAADNSTYGYFNYTPPTYNTLLNINNYFTMAQYNIVGSAGYDLEPDLFAYNMGGKSGKFIYTPGQGFMTIPFDPIKIQTVGSGSGITFQITDDNGIIYKFGQYSQTYSDFGVQRNTISSWYLTSMISPDYTDTIGFEYETIAQEDPMAQQVYPVGKKATVNSGGIASEVFVSGDDDGLVQTILSVNNYNELLIKKIKFKNGYVQFNRNTARKDNNPATKMLDEMLVYNNHNQSIKKISFGHDYFTVTPFLNDWVHHRLKLTGFTESDQDENNKKVYGFDYDANALPVYGAYNMDYWGFYNGSSNQSLIPTTTVYANELNNVSFANGESYSNGFFSSTDSWTIGNANREPSATYMKAAILNKINYPTGGYSLFEYEPHKYLSDDYVKQSVAKGGVSYGIDKFTKSTSTYNFSFPSDLSLASVNVPFGRATLNINFSASNIANTEFGETQLVTLTDLTLGTSQTWKHEGDLTIPSTVNAKLLLYPNHSYTLKNEIYGPSTVTIQSSMTWDENTSQHLVKIGGGLRIKSIKNYTDNNLLVGEENYTYGSNEDGLGVKLFDERNFYRNYEDEVNSYFLSLGGTTAGPCVLYSTLWQRKFLGISKYNSINYMGSPVLYSRVVKYEGDPITNIGKTVYNYNITPDPVNLANEFINSGNYGSINNAWRQGELISDTVYKKENGQYIEVSATLNEYSNYNQASQNAILFKQHRHYIILSDCFISSTGPEPGNNKYGQGYFTIYPYVVKSGVNRKTKETKIVYDQDNISKSVTTVTTYQYQNAANRYMTETSVTTSLGDGNNTTKVTRLKYPQDVNGSVQTAMVNKNILTPVLEEKIYKSVSGTETLLSTIQTNYMQSGDLIVKSNLLASMGTATPETRVNFNQYDIDGNILEQQKANDTKHSYVWDYNASYPIAEATNASYSDIAYSSFEADGKGNWTFAGTPFTEPLAPTGKKVYDLSSGSITKSVNSATTYIVSYWRPEGLSPVSIAGTMSGYPVSGRTINGWKYYEHKISAQSTATISGSGTIDELRLYPAGAMMTTYTYDPLIGMTSQCDMNNRITYYEYDGFGRLMLVRDQDKNILKQLCYNYAGQVQDCNAAYAPAAPPAPGNLTAVINAGSAVELNWVNNAVNATVNEVYRSAGDATHYALLVTLPDNVSTYTDTQTDINTLYFYKIKAAGSGGSSAYSNEKSITTPAVSPSALSNTAPALNGIADIYVRSGSSKTAGITATDDAGDILGFVVSGLPTFAAFSENGNGTGSFHLSPVNTAPGSFSVTVKVIDKYGAYSHKVINIIVVDKDTAAYHINFNNIDYPVADPLWNSFNSTKTGGVQVLANTILYALKDETGTASAINVKLLNSWPQNYLGAVTGDDSGVYPDAVIATGYYFYVQASAPAKTIKIAGLKADKKYDLTFYGNRTYGSDQVTNYTVGAQTVTLNARNNTSNTVQITGLAADSQGEIDIVVDAVMGKYATINAMVITEYPNN